MRIIYFTERDSPHDQRFLKALAESPHEVYALRQYECQPQTPGSIQELRWPHGTPDWSHWQGWREGVDQLKTLIDNIQPNLIHAGPVQGPALITALTGFHPLLTMSWGSDMLVRAKRSPWMRCATQFTLAHTDICLVDCQVVKDAVTSFGFPAERIMSFPWGVDLEHFSPENGGSAGLALRRDLGWKDNFVLMCNRTWSPLYGVDVLARAFVTAAAKEDALRLLLIGGGPKEAEINAILQPFSDKVRMPGWMDREALPAAYCAADLYVTPSHSDGSSISLLEAMACGRPVLASDIPGNQEWVEPGVNGGVFRDGNVQSLAAKILAMAEDPGLTNYGQQSRLVAEERANWDRNFEKLLHAYAIAAANSR